MTNRRSNSTQDTEEGRRAIQIADALYAASQIDLAAFQKGDPGKYVQALLPTPEWKALAKACQLRGVSLSLMLRVAVRNHLVWLNAWTAPDGRGDA